MAKLLESAVLLESAAAASATDLFLSICLNIIHVLVGLQSLGFLTFSDRGPLFFLTLWKRGLGKLILSALCGAQSADYAIFCECKVVEYLLENQRRDGAGRFFRLSEVYHENARLS